MICHCNGTASSPANSKRYSAPNAVDGDNASRWAVKAVELTAWLQLDLGKEEEISRI